MSGAGHLTGGWFSDLHVTLYEVPLPTDVCNYDTTRACVCIHVCTHTHTLIVIVKGLCCCCLSLNCTCVSTLRDPGWAGPGGPLVLALCLLALKTLMMEQCRGGASSVGSQPRPLKWAAWSGAESYLLRQAQRRPEEATAGFHFRLWVVLYFIQYCEWIRAPNEYS